MYLKGLNMSLFNVNTFIQGFVMICFTINIAHAGVKDEYNQCINQIHMAFGNNHTATGCLKHAIKYYVKGHNFANQSHDVFIDQDYTPRQIKLAFAYQNQNVNNTLYQDQNVNDKISNVQAGGSQYTSKSSHVSSDFNILESSHVSSINNNGYNGNNVPSSSQNIPKPLIKVNSLEELMSIRKKEPPTQVESLSELISSGQKDNHIGEQKVNVTHNAQAAEHKEIINYAALYHEELEYMIQGVDVPNRYDFCDKFYTEEYVTCVDALKTFGSTSISAVRAAFKYYTIHLFVNIYLYKYMELISQLSRAGNLSKNPKYFCTEITEKMT